MAVSGSPTKSFLFAHCAKGGLIRFYGAAEQYVLTIADRMRAAQKAHVAATVLDGSPASAIVDYAATAGIDLVVMSSHERTGTSRFWLGSVAGKVIRGTACSIPLSRAR